MNEMDKVISKLYDLRQFADTEIHPIVSPDNWDVYSKLCDLIDLTKADALAMLKEQEPVEPWLSYDGNEYLFHCTACDAVIYHNGANRDETKAREYAKFCRQCGRRVKWDG